MHNILLKHPSAQKGPLMQWAAFCIACVYAAHCRLTVGFLLPCSAMFIQRCTTTAVMDTPMICSLPSVLRREKPKITAPRFRELQMPSCRAILVRNASRKLILGIMANVPGVVWGHPLSRRLLVEICGFTVVVWHFPKCPAFRHGIRMSPLDFQKPRVVHFLRSPPPCILCN